MLPYMNVAMDLSYQHNNYIKQLTGNDFSPELAKAFEYVKNKSQASSGLICTSMLSTMACACQGNINFDCEGIKPVSLNTIVIAGSGDRKTTVDKEFSNPIMAMDAELETEYEKKLALYNSEMKLWEISKQILEKQFLTALKKNPQNLDEIKSKIIEHDALEPSKPKKTKYILEDVTIEALYDALSGDAASILLTSNEGGTITKSPIFNNSPVLNKIWDNQNVRIDRKSVPSYIIKDARLSISIMIQNGLFDQFIQKHGDELRQSGFFARCLICKPDSTQGTRFKDVHDVANPQLDENVKAFEWFQGRVVELIKETHRKKDNGEPKELMQLTPEAKIAYVMQYNLIESQLSLGGRFYDFRDIGSRYMEQLLRIASVLQYFTTNELLIDIQTIQGSINILEYYISEFLSIFSKDNHVSGAVNNANVLNDWLHKIVYKFQGQGPYCNTIPKNYIRQHGPYCIRDKVKLDEAINHLQAQGRISIMYQPFVNRRNKIWVRVHHNL